MTKRWLILADDLTGAADCGIAFVRRGLDAAVGWGDEAGMDGAISPVLSYDTGSRSMTVDAAVRTHRAALDKRLNDTRVLFKKIDSTLRGHPAAEIAATIAHLKARSGTAFGVFAPAFPATGRTTIDGRIRVSGQPLESTQTWQRDHSYPSADLIDVLATAGVEGEKVSLATIRGNDETLKGAFAEIAGKQTVLAVCDAETDDDLRRIAAAGSAIAPHAFFVGSAGLAHAIAALTPKIAAPPPGFTSSTQGALIVVGSLAATSRAGAITLAAQDTVVHIPVDPDTLLSNADGRAALGQRVAGLLDTGVDVLVEVKTDSAPDMSLGPRLVAGLAEALESAAPHMSGFAATGGETAAALLSRFGVNGIRLLDEIEPGVALGLTLGRLSIPVATKAGAFGDDFSLSRIAARLRLIRHKGTLA